MQLSVFSREEGQDSVVSVQDVDHKARWPAMFFIRRAKVERPSNTPHSDGHGPEDSIRKGERISLTRVTDEENVMRTQGPTPDLCARYSSGSR